MPPPPSFNRVNALIVQFNEMQDTKLLKWSGDIANNFQQCLNLNKSYKNLFLANIRGKISILYMHLDKSWSSESNSNLIRGGVIIKKQENLGQCPK